MYVRDAGGYSADGEGGGQAGSRDPFEARRGGGGEGIFGVGAGARPDRALPRAGGCGRGAAGGGGEDRRYGGRGCSGAGRAQAPAVRGARAGPDVLGFLWAVSSSMPTCRPTRRDWTTR